MLIARYTVAKVINTKLGYGIEIKAHDLTDKHPETFTLKCGTTSKKYTEYREGNINRHNHIMGLVKRFVEEEMSSMFHDLNYTVVSLTGNRWVAVSIDTV